MSSTVTASIHAVGMNEDIDSTKEAWIEFVAHDFELVDAEGEEYRATAYCSIALARELAPYILGGTVFLIIDDGIIKSITEVA